MNNFKIELWHLIPSIILSIVMLYFSFKIIVINIASFYIQIKMTKVFSKYSNLKEIDFYMTDAFVKVLELNKTKLNLCYVKGWSKKEFPQSDIINEYCKNDTYKTFTIENDIKESELFNDLKNFIDEIRTIRERSFFIGQLRLQYKGKDKEIRLESCK